jgi:hypothetical protein
MTKTDTATPTRRNWVGKLALLCSPSFPNDTTKALLQILPHLDGYGDEYFTDTTAEAIAASKRRQSIPSLDEIVQVFAAKRYDDMPVHVRMGGALPVKQIIQQFVPDNDDVKSASLARAERAVAALRAKPEAMRMPERQPVEPHYFTKRQLALAAIEQGVKPADLRPDLAKAYAEMQHPEEDGA